MSTVSRKDKYKILLEKLKKLSPFVLAFSGGVDSTFLAAAAKEAEAEFEAVTVNTPFVPSREIEELKKLAAELALRHQEIYLELDELGEALENNAERCYYCKKVIFSKIKEYADGITVIEGSNLDDSSDYRPGRKALREMGVKSPLLDVGLNKYEIRELSREMDLETWNKPSMSCLATRVSYNNNITKDKLEQIELSEELLRRNGFRNFRVRYHNNLARIELGEKEREKILDIELMDKIDDRLQKLGFKYVTLDLSPYKSGSMNKEILEEEDV